MTFALLLSTLLGYLLGSIPFGLVLTRAAGLGDIRTIGSGNIGATNVLRTDYKALAAATLLLDMLKGTAAVLLAPALALVVTGLVPSPPTATEGVGEVVARLYIQQVAGQAAVAAAYGAFIGHLYPVWLGFKGGKGVATYIGVLLGLFWKAALVFAAVWLIFAAVLRYSSLSALVASLAVPVATALLGRIDLAIFMVPLSLLLIWRHHANIRRLLNGQEPRIGAKG